ncbi:MAG TPA: [LysW]-lysine hydrolase [Ktedonobacteraceae bacterium]|nr:[LysW]-lysine hydrolase [Ktedonobacteraceae bacterium]
MIATIELENTYTSGVYKKRPVVIQRGSGAVLWDEQGREYLDCAAGHGVANIGHGRPEIAAALAAQAQRLITCSEIVYNDARARLLERLAHLTPPGLSRIFLCNSGTEAVEGALKFARLATGRTGIVATLRGFHGRTMGALATTWEPHYREPFAPLVPDVRHIRYNDLAAAQAAIDEQTAAVIIELVQGEGGVHIATEDYVNGLASLCRERGALLIVDEVQTGFGRTGRLFACNHYDLQPDILCLAKSLGGGIPMGAICLGPRVTESGRISGGVHGSTFGGNPLACAAALTTLDIIEQEALPERAATLGAIALERLRAMHSPLIREVRGKGLLLGIELNRRAQPYLEALLERGILALPAGPNVIRLLPPLVITEEQLERVLDCLEEVLECASAIRRGGGGADVGRGRLRRPPLSDTTGLSGRRKHAGDASVPSYPDPTPTMTTEVALLYNMLTIPSYSGQEGALAGFLVEEARRMGLQTCVDDAGNFVASTGSLDAVDMDSRPVVLPGHMDTVRGNIPVRLQDGALYGRGAVDAKGPLAAFVCASARLARSGSLRHPIVVIGAVEEEAATSRGARAIVDRYRPLACIIGEPSGSRSMTIGYKGRLLVEYCITRPIHHSAGPQQNSSEAAAAFWNRVRDHAAEWNEQHAGNSAFAALMPSLRSINSGQDGLEERTWMLIGYRLPPAYDVAGLRSQLEQWANEDGAVLTFSGEEAAFQTTRATPLARAFIAAVRATSGEQPAFKYKTGTSDMNVVGPVWGQNILAYGPGDARLDHTPGEHIHVAEYAHAIDVLELVLRELTLQERTTS